MKTVFKRLSVAVCVSAMLATCISLRADDVTEQVDEAMKAYKDKDYAGASQGLEAAAQLIRQKRAEALKAFMPEAPAGWTAEEATSTAIGAQVFGGGITMERRYTKGDASVEIKFLGDSPAMQSIMMLMNSGVLVAGGENGKLERIKGQKAIVKYDAKDKTGEISIAVAGSLLIQINGRDVTAAEMKSFAEAIDYAKLAAAL